MAVGVLLITHEGIGQAHRAVAERLLGKLPLAVGAFELAFDAPLDTALPLASAALRKVDGGDGVLLLSDLYGASPSRLARILAQLGTPARRIAGLSLPMLLRVLNHAECDLDELAKIAASGARNGAVMDDG
ncbi:MAG: PTS fructose IIA subunit family protein [Proteobacteria bacterium]|nr:PTS fructose IIA subunit family protein [Pseudomonadota bacterium]MBS0461591.1 PTS fructose IIA subunit family protein [Pseudomonadota bacterium]MBS0464143.1 PTS fructose IIA subunit family protein [Pseudomonadota bacterium]